VTLVAQRGIRSPFTGNTVPPEEFTTRYDTINYVPIIEIHDLPSAGRNLSSAKILANVLFIPHFEFYLLKGGVRELVLSLSDSEDGERVLESQVINRAAAEALRANDVVGFLSARAIWMSELASSAFQV